MSDDFDDIGTNLGATTARAAAALLHALGDGSITLRLPIPTVRSNADLGISGPLTEDVEFSPAVLQVVQPLDDGTARYEASIGAEAVEEEVEKRNLGTAEALFASVLGIVAGGKLLRALNATPHLGGGAVYLYKLQARG
jgi:hypothetical protein